MATTNTTGSVATDIASLFSTITQFQSEINAIEERHTQERAALNDKHRTELNEKNAEFTKAKADFASYLKQAGIDTILAPAQGKGKGKQAELFSSTGKNRKARTSSDEVKATLTRNLLTYISEYPNGIDSKSGLPRRFKGKNKLNEDIDALMKQDEEAYAATRNNTEGRNNLTQTIGGVVEQLEKAYGSPIKNKPAAAKAK